MKTGQTLLKGAVLLAGLCVAGLLGACGYQYLACANVQHEIRAQQDTITRTQRQIKDQQAAQDTAVDLSTYIDRRDTHWAWSGQFKRMAQQVSDLTKGTDAVIDTLQPAPVMGKTALVRFPLRLTLHSSLGGLTKLLHNVRGATPVLAVDGLTLRCGQKSTDPLQVDLSLSAYVLLEDQTESGGDA